MVLRTYRHPERSRGIFLAEPLAQQLRYFNHRLLPIPSHSSLLSNLMDSGIRD